MNKEQIKTEAINLAYDRTFDIDLVKPKDYSHEEFERDIKLCADFAFHYGFDAGVKHAEEWMQEIKRRQELILSEPNGIVRETMIQNLLIDLIPSKPTEQ